MALTKITNSAIADDIGLGGNPTTSTQTAGDSTTRIATTAFVSTAVANLVDSAPDTLNTLAELATSIGNNATLSSTLTSSIATKLPLAGGTLTGHLNLGDNVIAKFGLDSDLQIYHSGSKSYIKDTGTGNLAILTSTLELNNAADSQNMIVANEGGAVNLFHSGSAKLATTNTGIDVTGNIGVTGTVDGVDIAARDAVLTSTTTTAGAALPKAGGTMTGNLVLGGDDRKITFGASNDLEIYHSGSDSYIRDVGTGGLRLTGSQIILRNAANSGHMLNAVDGGAVSLYHNTSTRLETTSTGINVTGKIVAGDASSTSGDVLLEGYYGNGATVVIGSERSSGGVFLGYGVQPSVTTQGEFLSSTTATLSQGAYVVSDTHKWYTVTGGSSVAVGSQLTTMTERMRITGAGNVGIGTDTPAAGLQVSKGLTNAGGPAAGASTASACFGNDGSDDNYGLVLGADGNGLGYISAQRTDGVATAYNLSIQPNGGNVGIGTSSPSEKLEVDGGIKISNGNSRLYFGTEGGTSYRALEGSTNGSLLQVGENYTDIALQGNVGIGTTNPGAKLEISGFSTGAGLKLNYGNSSGTIEAVNFIANGGANGVIGMQMVSAGVGDLWLGGSGGRSLTLYRDGNVGIGTTAPDSKLDVTSNATRNAGGSARFGKRDDDGLFLHSDASSTSYNWMITTQDTVNKGFEIIPSTAVGNIEFTYPAFVIIADTGNVGIGTTSPGSKLTVQGSSASTYTGAGPTATIRASKNTNGNWIASDVNGKFAYFGVDGNDAKWAAYNYANNTEMGMVLGQSRMYIKSDGNVGIGTNAPAHILHVKKPTSGDAALMLETVSGGDPTLLFNSAAANRSGLIRFQDNGTNVGRIQYVHSGDRIDIQAGSATGATMSIENGKVGIGTTSPETTIDLEGALLMRANTANIGLGTYTSGSGMTPTGGGELQFMHMWSGVMAANDTIVFTYAATSWKSFWFEITAASTSGYGHSHLGGYSNNSLGYHDLETIHTSMWSLAASNNGQALTFTVTLNANWIHPLIKIKFGCGGGEGAPKLDRCSLVITS